MTRNREPKGLPPIIEAEVVEVGAGPPPADDNPPPLDDADADIAEFEELLNEIATLRSEGTEVEHLTVEKFRELRKKKA